MQLEIKSETSFAGNAWTTIMFENITESNNIEYNKANGGITFSLAGVYKISVLFGYGQSSTSNTYGGIRLFGFTSSETIGMSQLNSQSNVNGGGYGADGESFAFLANVADTTDQYLLQFGNTKGYTMTVYDPSSYTLDGLIFPNILTIIEYVG